MVVQEGYEPASEFANRLEKICYDLSIIHKDKITMSPIVFLTSASDGRQTATIQFVTNETDKTKDPVFDGFLLRMAYDKFKERRLLQTPETDELFKFLLSEVVGDYNNK